MTLIAFFLGLTIGIGLWLWQYTQFQQKLRHLLRTSQSDSSEVSLPLVPLMRREIALQQQIAQKLQGKLQTYENLLDVAPLGYLQVDEENQLLWCNEQARQLLGLQKWEAGQVRLLLELVRSYELDQLIEQTREQQQRVVREWVFHPPCADAAAIIGRQAITLKASSLPLPEAQVGVFIENRQPLVDLSQSRDRSVADLAHELRTPLTSIRLVVETLQEQLQPPMLRWVERLVPEVERLINLVENWLELSQLETNPRQQLNHQSVEVRSLIHSVWQTLEPLAKQKQLSLTYSDPEAVWLRADQFRLYRVFLNLLDNSIKYSSSEGTISVTVHLITSEDSKHVQINVIDSGSGFADWDLPHVFKRLYRGDRSRTREPGAVSNSQSPGSSGSGLGLAIVQQIVFAHGGSVKAMNHPDTGGAWIQIELPDAMAGFST